MDSSIFADMIYNVRVTRKLPLREVSLYTGIECMRLSAIENGALATIKERESILTYYGISGGEA